MKHTILWNVTREDITLLKNDKIVFTRSKLFLGNNFVTFPLFEFYIIEYSFLYLRTYFVLKQAIQPSPYIINDFSTFYLSYLTRIEKVVLYYGNIIQQNTEETPGEFWAYIFWMSLYATYKQKINLKTVDLLIERTWIYFLTLLSFFYRRHLFQLESSPICSFKKYWPKTIRYFWLLQVQQHTI